jgi:hypothetical protein
VAESRTTITAPGRLIFGLMTFTVVFSLVGEEISTGQGNEPKVSPFLIIFGGTVATSLLVLLSHAGEGGEELATGLALVTFISAATAIYTKPVWDAANKAFGSTPTKATAKSTPTTRTTGLATPTALAQIA